MRNFPGKKWDFIKQEVNKAENKIIIKWWLKTNKKKRKIVEWKGSGNVSTEADKEKVN